MLTFLGTSPIDRGHISSSVSASSQHVLTRLRTRSTARSASSRAASTFTSVCDIRRDQDVINPTFHSDIHVLAHDDDTHPFWYARVLGIFHVNIINQSSTSRESAAVPILFLWVRWYNFDKAYRSGRAERRLHRIGFVPGDGPDAFDFINPADIVRASHLIPAFALGLTREILPPSSLALPGCDDDNEDEDYAKLLREHVGEISRLHSQ